MALKPTGGQKKLKILEFVIKQVRTNGPRLEFIILAREAEEDMVTPDDDEDDLEWSIPDQDTFDEVVAEAVYHFTENHMDRLESMAWSSTGWKTGVGLVALTTDKLQWVEEFRQSVAQVELDGRQFITLPKQMLLKKYALTVYFGRIFTGWAR